MNNSQIIEASNNYLNLIDNKWTNWMNTDINLLENDLKATQNMFSDLLLAQPIHTCIKAFCTLQQVIFVAKQRHPKHFNSAIEAQAITDLRRRFPEENNLIIKIIAEHNENLVNRII